MDVERDMETMFTITNNKGEVIARYNNRSEVDTFMSASVQGGKYTYDTDANPGMVTVFDDKSEEQFRVSIPQGKKWE